MKKKISIYRRWKLVFIYIHIYIYIVPSAFGEDSVVLLFYNYFHFKSEDKSLHSKNDFERSSV